MNVADIPVDAKIELLNLLEIKEQRKRENWLAHYKPYAKQREFHARGAEFRERLFIAANQSGKTYSGAAEVAMHATGIYPIDWPGRRFPRATRWIVGSESGELTRKGVQRLLLGPPEKRDEWGTGSIPKAKIKNWSMKSGVPDAVASVTVEHVLGQDSVIQFASYDQGRSKWQADTVDGVWLDEEPPEDIYYEALTRTNATGGMVFVTFTPLLGMSAVVKRYLTDKAPNTTYVNMTIDDVEHYSVEERQRIIDSYPEHERDARARGIPIMGSGLVFPVAESTIKCDPFDIPQHWARINAIDLGIDHPAAFVALAHDRDNDTVYLYDAWRVRNTPVPAQAMLVVAKGLHHLPTAWPHDGLQRDKGSGEVLKDQYKKFGMNMLDKRATFPDGSNGVEAGLSLMLERFQSRRLRVFSHINDWFEEFRLYHRKDGMVVKKDDDIMSATRYGIMMLREAKNLQELQAFGQGPASLGRFDAFSIPGFQTFDPSVGY